MLDGQFSASYNDEARWLVSLISDKGIRLSEAAALHVDDIILDTDVPHIDLKPHPWRRLKTRGSQSKDTSSGLIFVGCEACKG